MLNFYRFCLKAGEPLINAFLERRVANGKEIRDRLPERKGISLKKRPDGPLIWLHGASVGEAQSALILIDNLLKTNDKMQVIVTTITVTSAKMLENKLPERAFHQFYPVDHPDWVESFLDHWSPDMILWMESEIWPNMLCEIKERNIPAALINARLSERSYKKWRFVKYSANKLLGSFSTILSQTSKDAQRFLSLGAKNVTVTDNIKYSARPLDCVDDSLKNVTGSIVGRPFWLFASTHKGEEKLACKVHETLKNTFSDLLTIIVPRHPERREDVKAVCEKTGLSVVLRGENQQLPEFETDIYIADTLGELGLFYRLAPVAVIGRSFSDDGGGGHNPIEAAQLNCAVLHGPNVQYQQEIFDEMGLAGAALEVSDENQLVNSLREMLNDSEKLYNAQQKALEFARDKESVIDRVMESINPLLEQANLAPS